MSIHRKCGKVSLHYRKHQWILSQDMYVCSEDFVKYVQAWKRQFVHDESVLEQPSDLQTLNNGIHYTVSWTCTWSLLVHKLTFPSKDIHYTNFYTCTWTSFVHQLECPCKYIQYTTFYAQPRPLVVHKIRFPWKYIQYTAFYARTWPSVVNKIMFLRVDIH